MDGWMDGWMGGKAGLRIAYSNQKIFEKVILLTTTSNSSCTIQFPSVA
jgi:hypothetical protein